MHFLIKNNLEDKENVNPLKDIKHLSTLCDRAQEITFYCINLSLKPSNPNDRLDTDNHQKQEGISAEMNEKFNELFQLLNKESNLAQEIQVETILAHIQELDERVKQVQSDVTSIQANTTSAEARKNWANQLMEKMTHMQEDMADIKKTHDEWKEMKKNWKDKMHHWRN